jgi:hypothetical protein
MNFSKKLLAKAFFTDIELKESRTFQKGVFDFCSEVFHMVTHVQSKSLINVKKTLYFVFCIYCLVRGVKNRSTLESMRHFILNEIKSFPQALYLKKLVQMTIHQLV